MACSGYATRRRDARHCCHSEISQVGRPLAPRLGHRTLAPWLDVVTLSGQSSCLPFRWPCCPYADCGRPYSLACLALHGAVTFDIMQACERRSKADLCQRRGATLLGTYSGICGAASAPSRPVPSTLQGSMWMQRERWLRCGPGLNMDAKTGSISGIPEATSMKARELQMFTGPITLLACSPAARQASMSSQSRFPPPD